MSENTKGAAAPQVVADERAAFHTWWADFADAHEEWPFADSGALRWAAYQAGRAAAPVQTQHPDDAAVDRFATAMKDKLAASREKGRGGWDDPTQCSVEKLAAMLCEHIEKGDPVDIANFAMMIHQRGGSSIDVYEALAVFLNSRAIVAPVQAQEPLAVGSVVKSAPLLMPGQTPYTFEYYVAGSRCTTTDYDKAEREGTSFPRIAAAQVQPVAVPSIENNVNFLAAYKDFTKGCFLRLVAVINQWQMNVTEQAVRIAEKEGYCAGHAAATTSLPVAVPDGWIATIANAPGKQVFTRSRIMPVKRDAEVCAEQWRKETPFYHIEVVDVFFAAPAAQGDAVKLECCGSTELCERVTCPAQGDAKELTDDEIVQVLHLQGVDTYPSKYGFGVEQVSGMSVTTLRQVIAAIAAKAAS